MIIILIGSGSSSSGMASSVVPAMIAGGLAGAFLGSGDRHLGTVANDVMFGAGVGAAGGMLMDAFNGTDGGSGNNQQRNGGSGRCRRVGIHYFHTIIVRIICGLLNTLHVSNIIINIIIIIIRIE